MQSRERIGFLEGLGAPWGGLGWIIATPSSWLLALVPTVVFLALLAGILTGGIVLSEHLIESWINPPEGTWSSVLHWLARAAGWIVAILVGFILAITLAQPLSGPALDALARKREVHLGVPPHPESPLLQTVWRSLRVSVFGLAVTLPVILLLALVGIFFPPAAPVVVPLKVAAAGLMLAWDLVDYPLGLRSAGIRARLSWFRMNFAAALGMGISLWILFLVPGAQLVLLGAGVAGAARLVVETE